MFLFSPKKTVWYCKISSGLLLILVLQFLLLCKYLICVLEFQKLRGMNESLGLHIANKFLTPLCDVLTSEDVIMDLI